MLMRPEGQSPRRRRRHSDPEQPEITFGWEPFGLIARELRPLFVRHYAERPNGSIPFDLDWDRLFDYANRGILHAWTARADAVLIGYIGYVLTTALHTQTLRLAIADAIYLVPEWRLGMLGLEMWRASEAALKDDDMADFVEMDTNDPRLIKALSRDGFKQYAVQLRKAL